MLSGPSRSPLHRSLPLGRERRSGSSRERSAARSLISPPQQARQASCDATEAALSFQHAARRPSRPWLAGAGPPSRLLARRPCGEAENVPPCQGRAFSMPPLRAS